jgi:hypothetical protein
MLKNGLGTLKTIGEEAPIIGNQNMVVGGKIRANPVKSRSHRPWRQKSWCAVRSQPVHNRNTVQRAKSVKTRCRDRSSRRTARSRRVEISFLVYNPVMSG